MTFLKPERTTGEYVAEKMVTFLDLPIENIRGQGCDDASSMSSECVGKLESKKYHLLQRTYIVV